LEGADAAIEVREDLRDRYAQMAERFGPGDLLRMLAIVAELDTEGRFRKSANPRTMLEALLLRFAYLERTIAIEDVIAGMSGGGSGGGSNTVTSAPAPAPSRRARSPAGPETASARPAPAAPEPPARESRPETPQQPASRSEPKAIAGSAEAALRALVRRPGALPQGLGILLATAAVREEGDDVILDLPPGPGLERVSGDPVAVRALQDGISAEIGRKIRVRITGAPEAPTRPSATPTRLTPERVRSDQLNRLASGDPLLGKAVKDWDLELFD
jgi:hypothetical protein